MEFIMLRCVVRYGRFLPFVLLTVAFGGCSDSSAPTARESITVKNAEEKGIDPEGAGVKPQKLEERKAATGAMN